jgi:hypothetical protein
MLILREDRTETTDLKEIQDETTTYFSLLYARGDTTEEAPIAQLKLFDCPTLSMDEAGR